MERLELSNNSIGDKGVQALAAALQTAPPLARLESIDLTGNDFHELGIGALAIAAGGRFQHQQQCQQQQWRWLEGSRKGGRKEWREGGKEQQQQQMFPDVRVYDGLLLGDLLGWQSSAWPVKRGEEGREGGVEGGAKNGGKAGGGGGEGGGGDARQLLFRRRQSQRMARREQQAQEEQQQQEGGKGMWGMAWDVVLYVLARAFGSGGGLRA